MDVRSRHVSFSAADVAAQLAALRGETAALVSEVGKLQGVAKNGAEATVGESHEILGQVAALRGELASVVNAVGELQASQDTSGSSVAIGSDVAGASGEVMSQLSEIREETAVMAAAMRRLSAVLAKQTSLQGDAAQAFKQAMGQMATLRAENALAAKLALGVPRLLPPDACTPQTPEAVTAALQELRARTEELDVHAESTEALRDAFLADLRENGGGSSSSRCKGLAAEASRPTLQKSPTEARSKPPPEELALLRKMLREHREAQLAAETEGNRPRTQPKRRASLSHPPLPEQMGQRADMQKQLQQIQQMQRQQLEMLQQQQAGHVLEPMQKQPDTHKTNQLDSRDVSLHDRMQHLQEAQQEQLQLLQQLLAKQAETERDRAHDQPKKSGIPEQQYPQHACSQPMNTPSLRPGDLQQLQPPMSVQHFQAPQPPPPPPPPPAQETHHLQMWRPQQEPATHCLQQPTEEMQRDFLVSLPRTPPPWHLHHEQHVAPPRPPRLPTPEQSPQLQVQPQPEFKQHASCMLPTKPLQNAQPQPDEVSQKLQRDFKQFHNPEEQTKQIQQPYTPPFLEPPSTNAAHQLLQEFQHLQQLQQQLHELKDNSTLHGNSSKEIQQLQQIQHQLQTLQGMQPAQPQPIHHLQARVPGSCSQGVEARPFRPQQLQELQRSSQQHQLQRLNHEAPPNQMQSPCKGQPQSLQQPVLYPSAHLQMHQWAPEQARQQQAGPSADGCSSQESSPKRLQWGELHLQLGEQLEALRQKQRSQIASEGHVSHGRRALQESEDTEQRGESELLSPEKATAVDLGQVQQQDPPPGEKFDDAWAFPTEPVCAMPRSHQDAGTFQHALQEPLQQHWTQQRCSPHASPTPLFRQASQTQLQQFRSLQQQPQEQRSLEASLQKALKSTVPDWPEQRSLHRSSGQSSLQNDCGVFLEEAHDPMETQLAADTQSTVSEESPSFDGREGLQESFMLSSAGELLNRGNSMSGVHQLSSPPKASLPQLISTRSLQQGVSSDLQRQTMIVKQNEVQPSLPDSPLRCPGAANTLSSEEPKQGLVKELLARARHALAANSPERAFSCQGSPPQQGSPSLGWMPPSPETDSKRSSTSDMLEVLQPRKLELPELGESIGSTPLPSVSSKASAPLASVPSGQLPPLLAAAGWLLSDGSQQAGTGSAGTDVLSDRLQEP